MKGTLMVSPVRNLRAGHQANLEEIGFMSVSMRCFIILYFLAFSDLMVPLAVAAEKSAEVHLFADDRNVTVIVLNPFNEPVEFIDSFNLRGSGPIPVYFKVSSQFHAGNNEATDEWIWPPDYHAWAVKISGTPVTLEPHRFMKKSWPIDKLVSPALFCARRQRCVRMLKFRITAVMKEAVQENPPDSAFVEIETPWVVYELPKWRVR